MTRTTGQEVAINMLAEFEAGATRADIAAEAGIGESAVYFTLRFGRFIRYRDQHPDDRADIGSWSKFDLLWGRTDKKAPEPARFAELICALPLATGLPAPVPRKTAKSKVPAPGCDWPLATEAAAIVAAKATPEPEPAPTPEPAVIAAPTPAPALDPIAARREAKTAAQRIRRALAKAAVQWRGEPERTAAAQ